MIDLAKVDFSYPNSDFRLHIDQLSFGAASKTAVIGPSGFGKSTLLNLIAGISIPKAGSIEVDGECVNLLNDGKRRAFRLKKIGFIFQDFKLLDYLRVMDNIVLPYRINSALKFSKKAKSNAREIASKLGIAEKLNKYPEKLSQGEKQRVAICRALLNDPSVILADEPTGNLDPENKQMIMSILFDYVKEKGSTLINVTHDHELLSGFDKIVDFKKLYKI